MIKYQLPHTQFDQISDHKHDIYLYGKLFPKLLAQAANKNTNFIFSVGWSMEIVIEYLPSISMVEEVTA